MWNIIRRMSFPLRFTQQMHELLGSEFEIFLQALQEKPPVSIRYNRAKIKMDDMVSPEGATAVAWCNNAYYLPERPVFTLDPLLHAGVYYVQEAASMFISQLLKEIIL